MTRPFGSFLLAVVVDAGWGTAAILRALRWAMENQEPTAADRRATLRVPRRLTSVQASRGWWRRSSTPAPSSSSNRVARSAAG